MGEKKERICSCGNIIASYYSDYYDTCYECRKKERERKISQYLRNLEDRLQLEKNSIIIVAGGSDQDDDMQCFNDYYDTLTRMKGKLEEMGCKPPFTIISNMEVYNHAGVGNQLHFIAVSYHCDKEIENLWDLEGETEFIKKVAVNERDYVLSRKWIKEWIFDDNLGNYETSYRLMLTDGKKAIITGSLVLI